MSGPKMSFGINYCERIKSFSRITLVNGNNVIIFTKYYEVLRESIIEKQLMIVKVTQNCLLSCIYQNILCVEQNKLKFIKQFYLSHSLPPRWMVVLVSYHGVDVESDNNLYWEWICLWVSSAVLPKVSWSQVYRQNWAMSANIFWSSPSNAKRCLGFLFVYHQAQKITGCRCQWKHATLVLLKWQDRSCFLTTKCISMFWTVSCAAC